MLTGVPILLYHRVGPRDGSAMDAYTVSPPRFRDQMQALVDGGWSTIGLEAAHGASPPAKRVVLTFDDGFRSNVEHAWPVLSALRLRSTTFVVTSLLGCDNAWDDAGMPRYPLVTEEEMGGADPGLFGFESHSASHATLTALDEGALDDEVAASKARLEALLGRPVSSFAYPFGCWNGRVREAVRRAGYRRACSCRIGRNNARTDPWLLRRAGIVEEDHGLRLQIKLRTGMS